jgi:hypothetical protein
MGVLVPPSSQMARKKTSHKTSSHSHVKATDLKGVTKGHSKKKRRAAAYI